MNKNIIKSLLENKIKTEYYLFNHIIIYIQDPIINNNIDIKLIIKKIENIIPKYYARDIDEIIIGEHEFLKKRNLNALYENGAIYILNTQSSNEDMLDDIIHEIAHASEELLQHEIYFDKSIQKEFLLKRKKLFDLLLNNKPNNKNLFNLKDFLNINYSKKFDNLLYKILGYDFVFILTNNLFLNPYSITSIREYFATGFEFFYLKNKAKDLFDICPILYNKIVELNDIILKEKK